MGALSLHIVDNLKMVIILVTHAAPENEGK